MAGAGGPDLLRAGGGSPGGVPGAVRTGGEAEMRTVYLFRHGQTLWNAQRRYIGSTDQSLSPEGRAALDAILPGLEQAGPYIDEVQIMGHTAQGNPNRANTIRGDRQLSSDRANEVLIYLLENSSPTLLDPARFQAIGMGQWRPIATNDTAEGRAKNRRVEMMISGRNVEEAMSDSVAAYYAETNQAPPELEAVDPAGSNAATEPETPPVDQTALEILGPDAVMGGANAGAGAG